MMPVIRVSQELYKELEGMAVGFDTPANVITRLLEERNVGKDDVSSSNNASSIEPFIQKKKIKKAITADMVKAVCKLGERMARGDITIERAKKELLNLGMSAGSAHIYLYDFMALLDGKVFKRGMKLKDFEYLLNFIRENYSIESFRKAVHSFELHLDYLASDEKLSPQHTNMLNELKKSTFK